MGTQVVMGIPSAAAAAGAGTTSVADGTTSVAEDVGAAGERAREHVAGQGERLQDKEEKKPDIALDYLISELYAEIERLKKQNTELTRLRMELERQVTELTVTAPARGSSARW